MAIELAGPAPGALGKRAAHVWTVALAVSGRTFGTLLAALSPDERARADRFAFERDRTAYVASHGALRQILARYGGCSPAAVQFGEGARGKPWARGGDLDACEFNLSHSGGFALVGVTRGAPIGVDIEAVRPLADMRSLAQHCFAPAEVRELERLPEEARRTAFFNAWTRKEAYIKAIGDGLSCPLDSFEVTMAPGDQPRLTRINGSEQAAAGWSLFAFTPGPEVIAAVAIGGAGFSLQHGWCVERDPETARDGADQEEAYGGGRTGRHDDLQGRGESRGAVLDLARGSRSAAGLAGGGEKGLEGRLSGLH